jgi:hypothetical protein
MGWVVRDNAAESRYEIVSGDEVGGIVAYDHENARSRGLVVVAQCPFIRLDLRRHREYADLVRAP